MLFLLSLKLLLPKDNIGENKNGAILPETGKYER